MKTHTVKCKVRRVAHYAIVPAAGVGRRFGGAVAKQFLSLNGRSVIELTLDLLIRADIFDKIIVCLPEEEAISLRCKLESDRVSCISGGSHRFESVYFGFRALDVRDDDIVLVHDGVRPLTTIDLIKRVASEVQTRSAVIPVVPIVETVKVVSEGVVQKTIDRSHLVLVQTPQGFRGAFLRKMYQTMPKDLEQLTDEAMYLETLGEPVYTVRGESSNIKITTKEDLKLAEVYLGILAP